MPSSMHGRPVMRRGAGGHVGCSDAVGSTETTLPPRPPLAATAGRVAFVSTRDGSSWIYVADSIGVRRLVPGDEPAWSPDGTTIAYQSANGISLIGADGTNDRILRAGGAQPADGRRIAFVRYDCCWEEPVAIYVVALDGTRPSAVMNGTQTGGALFSHWSPAWSPDGRSMAFIHNFQLVTIGVDARDLKFFGTRAAWESDLDWSPDGRRLVFSDYNGQRGNLSPPFTGHLRVYVAVLATGEVHQLIPEASGVANPNYWDNHAVWSR